MAAIAFDTFTIAQEFERVGFPKEQVAALTKAFVSSRSDPETVSKAELEAKMTKVEANVDKHESKVLHAISDLRKDIDATFESQRKDNEILRTDITWIKWILGVLATGIFVPLLKGIPVS